MKVFAFDRDHTIDVNPPRSRRAVPLEWVRYLAHETDHEVWAIGNQQLKREADIPGTAEAAKRHPSHDPSTRAVAVGREERVKMIGDLFPDAKAYIVVDDVNLKHLEGWTHFFPWEFVRAVESREIDVKVGPTGPRSPEDRTTGSKSGAVSTVKRWIQELLR